MRTHGWAGDAPRDDEEAAARIVDATLRCIDRRGAATSLSDVAKELGVTRQTVYRYFRSTDDLLSAAALDASSDFLRRIEEHLGGDERDPADAVVETIAFTLEQLPLDPYLGMLLTPGRVSIHTVGFTSPTGLALGRSILDRLHVSWFDHGFDDDDLQGLVEHMLRICVSFVVDPGTPPRSGLALRDYLHRWVAPALSERAESTAEGLPRN